MILDRNVDFPTEGNPTKAIRASPLLLTSKPAPPPEPAPGAGSSSWARYRASFLTVLGAKNVINAHAIDPTLSTGPSGIL